MYALHPSLELRSRFAQRPFQGAEPSSARFLFVGLDANYHPRAEDAEGFSRILEYHDDGVAFWREHGVHHPFLLPDYRGDGRRYHLNFSRIGFKPAHAELVSFVELLHLPTVGRNALTVDDLDTAHLRWLDTLMRTGQAQHIFVSAAVARLMRMTTVFSWLPDKPADATPLHTLHRDGPRNIHLHLHFSNYGKYQQRLEEEARAIAALI